MQQEKLGLSSNVIEVALGIYKDITKKCMFKGKSIKALSAAIIMRLVKRLERHRAMK